MSADATATPGGKGRARPTQRRRSPTSSPAVERRVHRIEVGSAFAKVNVVAGGMARVDVYGVLTERSQRKLFSDIAEVVAQGRAGCAIYVFSRAVIAFEIVLPKRRECGHPALRDLPISLVASPAQLPDVRRFARQSCRFGLFRFSFEDESEAAEWATDQQRVSEEQERWCKARNAERLRTQ